MSISEWRWYNTHTFCCTHHPMNSGILKSECNVKESDTDSDGWDLDVEAFMAAAGEESTISVRKRECETYSQGKKSVSGGFTCIPLSRTCHDQDYHNIRTDGDGRNLHVAQNSTPSPCTDRSGSSSTSSNVTHDHHLNLTARIRGRGRVGSCLPLFLPAGDSSNSSISTSNSSAREGGEHVSLKTTTQTLRPSSCLFTAPAAATTASQQTVFTPPRSMKKSRRVCCEENQVEEKQGLHVPAVLNLEAHDCGSMSTITLSDHLLGEEEGGEGSQGVTPGNRPSCASVEAPQQQQIKLAEQSMGSMFVIFDNYHHHHESQNLFRDEGGGSDRDAEVVTNIVKRRKKAGIALMAQGSPLHHVSYTTPPNRGTKPTPTGKGERSDCCSNAPKSAVTTDICSSTSRRNDSSDSRDISISPEELCRLEQLVPCNMREWSSLLHHCSIISREIDTMRAGHSSRENESKAMAAALRTMYSNLDRASVTVGAEVLLQMHVREKVLAGECQVNNAASQDSG